MTNKDKFLSLLTNFRKSYFPTTAEIYDEVIKGKPLGKFENFLMKIYFPSFKKDDDKKVIVNAMLNRIIFIAGISGILCLGSLLLNLYFLEGVFLILCLSSIIPYIAYVFAKKR